MFYGNLAHLTTKYKKTDSERSHYMNWSNDKTKTRIKYNDVIFVYYNNTKKKQHIVEIFVSKIPSSN